MSSIWDEAFDKANEVLPEEIPIIPQEESLSNNTLSLLFLGKLSKTIDIFGNNILIRTLKIGEELEVGTLVNKYKDTSEEDRAIITAMVAASLESINNNPIVVPLGPNQSDLLTRKFNWVNENLYWPVIKAIYEEYVELLKESDSSLEEIRKK